VKARIWSGTVSYGGRRAQGTEMKPLPDGPFGVVLADPNWLWRAWSVKGEGKSAQRHYRCAPVAEIAALPVNKIMARNSVLSSGAPGR